MTPIFRWNKKKKEKNWRNILNYLCCSFDDSADVKCKENLDAAVEADSSNAEAHQLTASYWLSKDDKQVQATAVNIVRFLVFYINIGTSVFLYAREL